MQHYLVKLLFTIMIFMCMFHGMIDARRHHSKSGKLHSKYQNHHYSDSHNHEERLDPNRTGIVNKGKVLLSSLIDTLRVKSPLKAYLTLNAPITWLNSTIVLI
ncbi:unnamed protein product [Rotaria magnacalcarata]|uniref:Uncharacterized protein n=1 Tax=Rotaria magnacalcarata TaxID=392030 RepID=A0A8S2L5X7_9BILA|nr:unnamed protein product [Rotaria magnacalcarata]